MNSRERVLTVFEHQVPDRVPCWCGASPEFWAKAKNELSLDDEGLLGRLGDDFRRVFEEYAGPELKVTKGGTYTTIFGIERNGIGYGQPLSHPLAEASLKEINDYSWPDPKWIDVSKIKPQAKKYKGQYAILGGVWAPYFHDAIDLLGMEVLYIKMYSEPEIVESIMKHIVDYYVAVNQKIFDAAADVIDIAFMGIDIGSTIGPLMGPNIFKKFLQPHLTMLADLAHSYGLKIQLHCCGGFAPLISNLIEAGIDSVQSLQPLCVGMEPAKLKEAFGRKIVLNGCIDSQTVLIEGNVDYVRQKTRETLDLMMPGGGYIASASHDTILGETPVENILAMFDTINEYGSYS